MHLLLRVRTIQNRPSTLILVEVEAVAMAKVVADLGRIRDRISLMICSSSKHTQVVEANLKVGGTKGDVTEVLDMIQVIAI